VTADANARVIVGIGAEESACGIPSATGIRKAGSVVSERLGYQASPSSAALSDLKPLKRSLDVMP
jgi:hypothetical protein